MGRAKAAVKQNIPIIVPAQKTKYIMQHSTNC
jgi:hypothetical protein